MVEDMGRGHKCDMFACVQGRHCPLHHLTVVPDRAAVLVCPQIRRSKEDEDKGGKGKEPRILLAAGDFFYCEHSKG